MVICGWPLAFLLLQAPGDGWVVQPTPVREIKRLYWELFQTSEIWVRIEPEHPANQTPLVSLIFQAFFPGPVKTNPFSGLPEEPKGPPARLTLEAQPLPLTAIRELSLRLTVDGKTFDLTKPGSNYRLLPCLVSNDNCTPNAVAVDLEPSTLRTLVQGHAIGGQALGFSIRLTEADRAALAKFLSRIGLFPAEPN